jgi:hypothetical protein
VVWGEALESATQSWTEVGGGWSATVLKEFTSDYWSQLVTFKDVQPGGVGVTYWYNDCCCLGMNHGACSGLARLGRPTLGTGPGYMAMCPCHGFTYVGHGGGSQPSLVVAPLEAVVVLLGCHHDFHHCYSYCHYRRYSSCFLFHLLLLPLPGLGSLPLVLPSGRGAKGGGRGAGDMLLE